MLPLSDPLWEKLDDAHRDRDVPQLLSELGKAWNDEVANSLLWDCLCHQETCYGATYAAIPHFLTIAQPEESRHQRLQIALFLGFVALCALERQQNAGDEIRNNPLPGLPETLDGWDQKLDCFRSLAASYADPDLAPSRYERAVLLPRYRKILAIAPVNAGDLQCIRLIKADFFSALPAIRALCERAFLENAQEDGAIYILSGVAAADRLLDLARLLNCASSGQLKCASCQSSYKYNRFGDRVAIYVYDNTKSTGIVERAQLDWQDRAPSRADGFISPAGADEAFDPRVSALLSLAHRAASAEPALLLRNFLGSFFCRKCGMQAGIRAC
jgi:hypothetical protein